MVDRERICIIGCGTYGSYLLKQLLASQNEAAEITVIEIGDEETVDSEEVGIATPSDTTKVSRFGRYFGLGGTSARWGGQILFFDERDVVQKDDEDWNHIIKINKKYKKTVLKRLMSGSNFKYKDQNPLVKEGLWLGYFKRNLYKRLKGNEIAKVNWLKTQRVIDFKLDNNRVSAVKIKNLKGEISEIEADRFYLTAGALESYRLLSKLKTEVLRGSDLGRNLGDHVSVELFKIFGSKPVLEGVDFTPRFIGTSLLTQRLLVTTSNGRVGFAHVVPNKDVAAFTVIKQAMFGREKGDFELSKFISSLKFLVAFGMKLAFMRKLHIDKNNWSLQLDIEQGDKTGNTVTLSNECDKYGEKGIIVDWKVSSEDRATIGEAKGQIKKILEQEGHKYEEMFENVANYEKMEDTYHPVGFIRMGKDEKAPLDLDCKVRGLENLYHFSTAMFRSAKSINPTGAGFCHIEAHLDDLY